MKAYTDIEQSRKLAEFLPLESADMWFANGIIIARDSVNEPDDIKGVIPCWSLAALLDVLSKSLIYTPNQALDGYCCKNIMHDLETYADNPIDACYEMIVKLHEQKLL